LSRQFGFDGDSEIEEALIDMYGEQLGDLFDAVAGRNMSQEETDKLLRTNINFFETRLSKNGNGFLVGSKLSWADIYLSQMTEFLGAEKEALLKDFPLVRKLDEHVRELPGVAQWIATRPSN
jgi:glutathione S-transferase